MERRTFSTRARHTWRAGFNLVFIAGSGALVPPAIDHALYATATLLAIAACAAASSILVHVFHTTQPQRVIEHRPTQPSDRAAQAMRALLDHAPVPLLTRSTDGTLHAANRAARRLFRTDGRLVAPPPALLGALEYLRPGERQTIRITGADGTPPRSYALMMAQAGGQPGLSGLVALTDIEADINASEAQALRELLSVLSHEIMNSLTPIASLAQSVADLLAEPDIDQALVRSETETAIGVILRRTRGLDRFVQGYRTLARLPEPIFRPTRLQDVIEQAAALFRTRWQHRVCLDVRPAERIVHARLDADLLEQALICLMTNGAEAALSGDNPDPRVGLYVAIDQDIVLIRIADNGSGIPPEHRDTIFRAFFSLKEGGNGIGLSLARQIVQAHGGTLTLDTTSALGGASFLIRL